MPLIALDFRCPKKPSFRSPGQVLEFSAIPRIIFALRPAAPGHGDGNDRIKLAGNEHRASNNMHTKRGAPAGGVKMAATLPPRPPRRHLPFQKLTPL